MSNKSKKTVYADSVLYNQSDFSNSLAWSEWSDSELNNEAWDYPKNEEFVDSEEVPMPSSLPVRKWKRFRELDKIVKPLVFDPTFGYPDFIVNNKHLLHSEFMRCFVSTIINIQYCGRNGLEIENSSLNFSWNYSETPWRGYYHVYSLNKAGKGITHQPIINSNGKYIVRIFFMGCWRRLLIDDTIPVDKSGRPLLPRTANENELWPMILAKAMLKVAAISWTNEREIVDCNFVTCLTGWIGLSLNVSHLSTRDQWEFLTKYAKHFEWPRDDKTIIENTNIVISEKDSKKQSKKRRSSANKKLQVPEETRPVLLFLNLTDMRDVDAEEIPGIAPCWNHQIYVELSRDVPLDPAQVKPPLARWKYHRWLDWAIRRGLIDPSEYFVPIRHLLVVSPLREFNDNNIYPSESIETLITEISSQSTITLPKKQFDKTKNPAAKNLPKLKSQEIELPEISLWGDFNKLSLYLREICLFYRKKFFEYFIEISDKAFHNVSHQEGRKSRNDENSTKDSKKSAPKSSISLPPISQNIYEYQDKILTSRNEPLYVFVDSIDEKFFLINLSTSRKENLSEFSKKSSSLIIERYNIFRGSLDDQSLIEITTRGEKSTVLQLESGRHLLRIFISTECSYHVTILSDTPFQIGNRFKMHELMSVESERIKILVEKISNNFRQTFESFGTENYSNSLKFYYRSYLPESINTLDRSNKKMLNSIHNYFQEEFLKMIENRFPVEESKFIKRALRIFFLNPSIGIDSSLHHENYKNQEIIEEIESDRNKSATLIQSLFRAFIVRRYKKIHESGHEEHDRVKKALLKIIKLFEIDKHEVARTLLRGTIKRDIIFESLYPCSKDFEHVIKIQELKGKITNVLPNRWIPIVRIVINAPRDDVFASIDLFANLPNYTLKVFANDTKSEMIRIINNVAPTRYNYRQGGYTIFGYGRTDFQRSRDIEWNLHLVTIKGDPVFQWLDNEEAIAGKVEIPALNIEEISGIYVPNIQNCITKIVLKIRKRSLVSLRLSVSYKNALTGLKVTDETGKILSEIEGGATLILSAIFLESINSDRQENHLVNRESDEKSRRSKRSRRSAGSVSHRSSISQKETKKQSEEFNECTRYFVEALVREDSWPLTESEWAIVAEEKSKNSIDKTKLRRFSVRSKISKNERKSKQFSKKSLEIGELLIQPYWVLQIITDAGNELEVTQDRRTEEKIEELKKIWNSEETDRSARGRRLREKFLENNSMIIDVPNEEMITKGETNNIDNSDSIASEISLESKRSSRPPSNIEKYLPKLNLAAYVEKDDEEEEKWVKTEYDEETLRNQRAMNILDFERLQSNFMKKSAQMMETRKRKNRIAWQRFMENCANRSHAIDEAYAIRQAYVDSTKNTEKSIKSKPDKQKKKN